MPEHEEVGLRELVEEIVESQMRHIQPERGAWEACAISVIAEVFELNPIDPRDKTVKRLYSASELLDQVTDVLEDPDLDEALYLNHLFSALKDRCERCTDPGYEGLGVWCDRLVAEADLPHRELGSDGVLEMKRLLRSELRRRKSPVMKISPVVK